MPRKKSIVHRHFEKADNQNSRKIEVVECIHCGHKIAGNNVSRLLKHLQQGCWPASSPDDPALLFQRPQTSHISLDDDEDMYPENSRIKLLNNDNNNTEPTQQLRSATQRCEQQSASSTRRRTVPVSDSPETAAAFQSYLLKVTVKDTKDPEVSRLLAIPKSFTFRHLQRALSVALGYRAVNGMFEITYPNWIPGRGRPPRRKQICMFHDEEQKNNWHAWDEPDLSDPSSDERYLDHVLFEDLLAELKSLKISFLVGPWAHDVELLGESAMSSSSISSTKHAACLAGEGHPVLESADSLMWQAFKDAYAVNPPTATQKSYRAFYEKECPTGDPRGLAGSMPWKWDINYVNRELGLLPPTPPVPHVAMDEERRASHEIQETPVENGDQLIQADESHGVSDVFNRAQPERTTATQNGQTISNNYGRASSYTGPRQPTYALEQLRFG